jgi:Concanavalin A-like lectin/glucanases superfamily
MIRRHYISAAIVVALVATGGATGAQTATNFVQTVEATHPLAFFRLDTKSGHSDVGPEEFKSVGGASIVTGAPVGIAGNTALSLNGTDARIDTTVAGGIQSGGSIMAWVNLAQLPREAAHILYVGGESQNGNDFDLQFEADNAIHFYTASGSNLSYMPDARSLVNRWHMIVVTVDFSKGARAIYWDGALAAHDGGGGIPNKTSEFSLGESTVFHGRFFSGALDEAALWNRALGEAEVAGIYAASKTP